MQGKNRDRVQQIHPLDKRAMTFIVNQDGIAYQKIPFCGPMAEAKFLGKSFDDVFCDYSSEADLNEVVRLGDLCGKPQQRSLRMLALPTG